MISGLISNYDSTIIVLIKGTSKMKSPKIQKESPTGHYILDASYRSGWKDACRAFQIKLRKERAQMKKLAEVGNVEGCYCQQKCKVAECLINL